MNTLLIVRLCRIYACVALMVAAPLLLLPAWAEEPSESVSEAHDDTAMDHAAKHLDPKYVCPMHPQIVHDEPGSCPICGMDLAQKNVEPQDEGHPVVELTPAVVQNMGVRTGKVRRDTLWKHVQTVGRVEYDETRVVHVHPRASGWIEKLKLRAEGDPVERGGLLGQIYSPEILEAQIDFLIALDQKVSTRTIEKASNRLRLLGVPESTIEQLQRTRKSTNTVPLYAPGSGIVSAMQAREGMYVKPEMEVFSIVDTSKMWVLVDVYEHQIEWLKTGLNAEIRVPAYPGRTWEGAVDYIYPDLDPRSRTLRVRLAFDNPDGLLKANMFADAMIQGGAKRDTLLIPDEALIETGERISAVKAMGDGRFQPVDVVTGAARAGWVEVLQGLEEGDEVIISGQFLIDSEASLQASFRRMGGDGEGTPAPHAGHAH